MTDQKPTKDPNDAAALSPENVVYGIAGMVFVILILVGPRPYAALETPTAQALPWMIAYGVDAVALLGCAIAFSVRRRWWMAVASFVFAGCAAGMCAAFGISPAPAGTW